MPLTVTTTTAGSLPVYKKGKVPIRSIEDQMWARVETTSYNSTCTANKQLPSLGGS